MLISLWINIEQTGQGVKFLGSPIITMEETLSNNNEAKSKCTIRIKYSSPIND